MEVPSGLTLTERIEFMEQRERRKEEMKEERRKIRKPIRLEKARAYSRRCYAMNIERRRAEARKWKKDHPEKIREFTRKWRAVNPEYMVAQKIVRSMFLSAEMRKESRTRQYIGCSPGFLRNHLESLFKPGMTWDNYGKWHIDHIIPLKWWDLRNHPEHIFEASHWTNLQPLWAAENCSKQARFAG